ncbi:1e075502-e0aa-4aa6-82ba-b5bbd1755d6f [Sclerotinia trifoliorum]|uniref:ferric-chelate reductase (NADPH) n=1 Tax=Sclerotinia trifoliorum TaxID=28548 RepID=A0A8H2ZRT8_9HELO|nr:1e075502-e0aa-4aa6-82ba-b5bbd1755d6f [Sclerotinia trifoliorum]
MKFSFVYTMRYQHFLFMPSGNTYHPIHYFPFFTCISWQGFSFHVCNSMLAFLLSKRFLSGLTQVHITHVSGAVRLRLQCRKPLAIKAGQYINLWIPEVNFWSFLQSHPFVVISWAEQSQDHLEPFIEPRRGITRKLLHHAKNGRSVHSLVLFSGPHGNSIRMDDCENILMVASDFGIAAQLPYLKQLIHGYNTRKLRTQRIHLVWQVRDIDVTIAVQPLINGALSEDTLDDGWILDISIYCESRDTTVSSGKRASVSLARPQYMILSKKKFQRGR